MASWGKTAETSGSVATTYTFKDTAAIGITSTTNCSTISPASNGTTARSPTTWLHIANFLIDKMKEKYPEFGLTGKLIAQGEDIDDRWELVIENGRAVKKETRPIGAAIICPHCDGKVYVDEAKAA